jgi:hypothetical protein
MNYNQSYFIFNNAPHQMVNKNYSMKINSLCITKQQTWIEFKLRFDTTYSSFNHSIELYQENNPDLDQLKVFNLVFFLHFGFFFASRTFKMN